MMGTHIRDENVPGDMMRKLLSFLLLLLPVCSLSAEGNPVPQGKAASLRLPGKKLNVLFISSFSKDLPAQRDFEKGLDEALGFRSGKSDFFQEFMDSPRISEGAAVAAFRFYLERKYRDVRFDFIIAWAPRATDFIRGNRELFPVARRIFVENAAGGDRGKNSGLTDAIYIVIQEDYRATLNEIMRIADPRHVYVVGSSGDSTAISRRKRFEDSLSGLPAPPEVHFIEETALETIASRLENIPRGDSVALLPADVQRWRGQKPDSL
jgi:hypothetical protein